MRRLGAAVAAVLLLGSLASCGDKGKPSSDGTTAAAATPAQALAAAKGVLDKTSGVTVDITSKDVPSDASALLSGNGTLVRPPAFDGTITVQVAGLKPQVPIISVDGKVHAQLPLTNGWQTIDPADYGVPDPAQFMATSGGLSDLLTATVDPTFGDKARGGEGNKEILTDVTGTLPASAATTFLPSIADDLDVTWQLTDAGELRTATLVGDFYGTGDTETYIVTLDHYGTTKKITAP
ncbi:LppX_LprAFG lipoprotein [Nocardioides sp. Kera G14]|uniref:LppX_LprAFG lipoprotein n=1 Tax=Nocardioides sp. Kera G14 TaxID=2884264 RepID=UPI001D0F5FFC|nr:LppX_LprAFG lipoprotein [Nocardioides sp. Kera G14]UDY22381.1 LppX_LprAFG lipoprotein [Nocardioides sp. Kera G14]